MELHTIGIDLARQFFIWLASTCVVRPWCARVVAQATATVHREPARRLDWHGGLRRAHFLGRALRAQGHEVRLMPAQYVKPYVKTNKNDYIDAEAIAEAVQDQQCVRADQDR